MARKNFDSVVSGYITQQAEVTQDKSLEQKDIPPIVDNIPSTPKSTKSSIIKKQKGFYITAEQERQIKLEALNRGTDTSSIVREALELYFKNN